MIPYVGGDDIGAIVADFGHHTTKMGFAGEDSPRAWFRSEVAVQRQSETEGPSIKVKDKSDMEIISSSSSSTSSGSLSNKYSTPISAIQYDYLSRPLDPDTGNDGDWDTFNPVDPLTGLLRNYDNPYCEIPPLTNPPSTSNTTATTTTIPPLWTHMFSHGMTTSLLAQTPELVTPILMVEKSYNPPAIRQKVTEILFEYFNAPAVFMARDAVMSCYACGRTTGVVVDIGSSGITVSPVYDGFVESRGVIRSPMGTTTAIDEYCLKRLDISCNNSNSGKKVEVPPFYQVRSKGKKRSDVFHRLCRLDMAKNFREAIALTADIGYDPEDSTNGKHLPKLPYKLPDGSNIDVECEERYNITETLFGRDDDNTDIRENACHIHKNRTAAHAAAVAAATAAAAKSTSLSSSNDGKDTSNVAQHTEQQQKQQQSSFFSSSGSSLSFTPPPLSSHPLPNIICDAAFQCDRDQQAQLLGNVILSGGGACVDNLLERVRDEVEGIIHTHTPGWKVKVLAPPIPERSVSAWLGGSILASLGSFNEMWMTRKEYEEGGSSIVNRKCP